MYRYIRHISTMLAAVAMTAMLGSCSTEDIDAPRAQESYTPGTQLVINLAVPETMETASAAESRTAGNDENYMDPTGNEGKINSLRLMGFLRDGSLAFNRTLLIPSEMPVNPNGTAIYEIRDVRPGDYHLYLVANLDEYVKNVANEAALKQVIVNMDAQHPLTSGNLPMVYEPDHYVTIPESASTNPDVELLSLKFACVKVKYDLLFDKAWNSDIFGDNGMVINDVTVSNVATSAYLVTNKTQHAQTRDGVSGNGSHYDSYTETPANASKPNVNVIGVSGKVSRPTTPTTKWAYEGILYLPERYATDKQTTLNISATVTDPSGADGTVTSRYTIPLGGYDDDEDCKELPRGTYYEVIAKIKTLGDAELDATIVTKDWMESKLSVDMVHTYLTLSKDAAEVKSLESDEIIYDTDGRGSLRFECESLLPVSGSNRNPAVIAEFNTQAKTITFRVNPAIDITTLPEDQQVGTANCYITAGNIRKLIRVDYDIKPFFEITPVALKIQWTPPASDPLNTKIFKFRTNLGGIDLVDTNNESTSILGTNISSTQHVVSNSRITISANPNASEGDIIVHLDANPETTTLHYFTAYPRKGMAGTEYSREKLKIRLQVTTMPPLGDYRIYFRAINDYHHYNGGSSSNKFLDNNYKKWPTEDYGVGTGTSANWNDWWKDDTYNNISDDNHKIYIYTQIGETTGTSTNAPVWGYSPGYGKGEYYYKEDDDSNGRMIKPTMTGDPTNRGWYYYDLNFEEHQHWTDNGATGNRKPKPGETLMLFYSGYDISQGYTLHRAAHHLDPGIPLFDYEDREGWIIYDPTSEPYYRIYDDKPYVEDIEYYVYSKEKITAWWNKYGVASNDNSITGTPAQFTIQYDIQSSDYQQVSGWYKTKIKLKASNGDYEKAIKLTGLTAGSSTPQTKQYVYYCANGNNPYNPPYIYLYNSGSDKLSDWSSTPAMDYWKTENGVRWYRYEIPARFANGHVIFKRQSYNVSGAGNQTATIDLEGKSWVNYGNNESYWELYGSQPSGGGSGVILFGGRSFATQGHVGTYNNGVWTAGAPAGITHTNF